MSSDNDLLHQPDRFQQPPQMKRKGNLIWIVIFSLLLVFDGVFGYSLYFSAGRIYLIKISFILLPISYAVLLSGYVRFINKKDSFGLLKLSFILLIIANLMFSYELYNQGRYGIGAGFLVAIPLIFILAINDLVAFLFLLNIRGVRIFRTIESR